MVSMHAAFVFIKEALAAIGMYIAQTLDESVLSI